MEQFLQRIRSIWEKITEAFQPRERLGAGRHKPKGNLWERAVQGGKEYLTQYRSGALLIGGSVLLVLILLAAPSAPEAVPVVQMSVDISVSDGNFVQGGYFDLINIDPLTVEYLREHIEISPNTPFTVQKGSAGRARVRLENYYNVPYTVTIHMPDEQEPVELQVNHQFLTIQQMTPSKNVEASDGVVLLLSEPVEEQQLWEAVDISPYTDFDLTVSGTMVTISPWYGWENGRSYTININGIESVTGKTLRNGFVGRWTVAAPRQTAETAKTPSVEVVQTGRHVWRDDAPMEWNFSVSNASDVPVIIETYRIDTAEKYRTQAEILESYNVDLSILERVESNVYLLKSGDNTLYVPTPGPGTYIAEISYSGIEGTHRTSFMVSDLSVYMQATHQEVLVWLNHYGTGGALSGYTVTLYDGDTPIAVGVSDADGTVLMDVERDEVDYYSRYYNSTVSVSDAAGNTIYVDRTNLLSSDYYTKSDRYYSYLYLDRAIYKPDDVISYWGIVRPFHQNTREMPDTVLVTFDAYGLPQTYEVQVDQDGVFTGEIPLDAVKSSQYVVTSELRFTHVSYPEPTEEDEDPEPTESYTTYYLDSTYIDVKEYVKPTYKLESSVDRRWYTNDQQVQVVATPTFYDGTPLPNFELEYQVFLPGSDTWTAAKTVTTDSSGSVTITFPARQGKYMADSIGRTSNRYMIRIASDGENITHIGSYEYFPTDIRLTGSFEGEGESLSYTVRVERLPGWEELTEEQRNDPNFSYTNLSGTPVAGAEVSLSTTWWGSRRYYRSWREGDKRFSVYTGEDGTATVEGFLDELGEDLKDWRYYDLSVRATFTDTDGVSTRRWNNRWYSEDNRQRTYYQSTSNEEEEKVPPGYSLVAYNSLGDDVTEPYSEYSYFDTTTFAVGEAMRFELYYQGQRVENPQGRLMYSLIQDGVAQRGIFQGDVVTLTQAVRNAPNVNLVVAYFDGSEVYAVRSMMIQVESSSLDLDIEVTADRESYRPGDTVTLRVRTTDHTGTGVGGNLLVSVVDESIFALKEQYVALRSSFFNNIYFQNTYVAKYTTISGDYTLDGGMRDEGKGGGDSLAFYDSYRSNFKDTAFFLPTRTDSGGNATVSFQLPDNTTSWRITTLSVGDNLMAGNAKDNIIATLPFFISPVVSEKYIVGDDIAMLVQGHGTLLDEESEIEYTVRVTGDGVDETLEATGSAYESVSVNFGKLPMGEYTYYATARLGGYSDTVEKTFAIINSNLELVIHREIDLGEALNIEAMRYPVVLTLYDEENDPFYKSIGSLIGHYCMVANQRMSRFVAKRALIDRMDPDSIPYYILDESNDSASNMQNADGGIGWSVGSPSEINLTAKVLLIAMDQFDLDRMADYFRNELRYASSLSETDVASCYLGLAAIGAVDEALIDEIYTLLEEGVSPAAQGYLVAALAYAEDAAAAEIYETLLHPIVAKRPDLLTNEEQGALASIWIAASKLSQDDADALSLRYAEASWRFGTLFECMIYVANYDKEVVPRSFTYEVNGVPRSVSLGLRGQYTLSFNRSEFETLAFTNVIDGIKAMAYYVGEPSEIDLEPSENISIDKTVEKLDDSNYRFTLEFTFTDEAPTGQYDISEWIPSNLRYYSHNCNTDISMFNEGQKMYFTLYRRSADKKVILTYYARVTFDSDAVVDSTYIIHGDSGENANTEKMALPQ